MVLFFAKLVHETAPDISIHIVTPRNGQLFSELASEYPFIIHECNLKSLTGIYHSFSFLKFILKKNIVITPATSGKIPLPTKIFARLISIGMGSILVGFDDYSKYNHYIYDNLFNFDENILYSESMIKLARDLGFSVKSEIPKLIFKKNESTLKALGLIENQYTVLHCRGSSDTRSLSYEEIISVIESINHKNPKAMIVLTGDNRDAVYIDEAFRRLSPTVATKVLNLSGKISINELVNVINSCSIYIGVDTGISHIASMLGEKSVVISHSSSVFYWLPYYNPNTHVVYSIKDCTHGIHEGLGHLKECYDEETKYLLKVPINIAIKYLERV